jgi:hypothetical protein
MRKWIALFFMAVSATVWGGTFYIDYENGNDTWDGTSKTHTSGTVGPWKHAPGMSGLTPANTSTGDGCTGNCASHTPAAGDKFILKGGVVWPYTALPWQFKGSGTSSTSTYGCTGSGCIYIGYDSTWNKGIVNSVTLTRDLGNCSPTTPPTVSISGGGGNGAAATALVIPAAAGTKEPNIAGFVYHVNTTNQGSGYTSNPAVTISGGGCANVQAVADIQRPVIDAGSGSNIVWPVGHGPGQVIWGPGLQPYGSYLIIDHLEIRNILQVARGVNGVSQGVVTSFLGNEATSTGHITYSNNYLHGRFTDCILNSCNAGNQEQADRGIILGHENDEASYNVVENGDGFYIGTSSTYGGVDMPREFSEHSIYGDGNIHHNYLYAVRWMIHAGGVPTLPTLIHDNEMWLVLYDVGGAHVNEIYNLFTTGTLYEYNNIFHNCVSGASNQQQMGNGTTQYFFNNISWGLGGGTSNWGIDGSFGAGAAGGHFYFYNNTMYGNGGTRNCIDMGSGPNNSAMFVALQNNHCITGANPYWNNQATGSTITNYAGSAVAATINASSVVQSASTATSQGYTQANVYAPTASANATVAFASNANSANLTSLCAGDLTPLCSDIYGKPRPTTGGWQAGAYQYSAIGIADRGLRNADYSVTQKLIALNPIKAVLLNQYLQINKNLMICDLSGEMMPKNAVNQTGLYVVRVKNGDLFQKVMVVR